MKVQQNKSIQQTPNFRAKFIYDTGGLRLFGWDASKMAERGPVFKREFEEIIPNFRDYVLQTGFYTKVNSEKGNSSGKMMFTLFNKRTKEWVEKEFDYHTFSFTTKNLIQIFNFLKSQPKIARIKQAIGKLEAKFGIEIPEWYPKDKINARVFQIAKVPPDYECHQWNQ